MRKIIPLIVLMALSVFFTKAQNVSQAESELALKLASQLVVNNDAAGGISADLISSAKVVTSYQDAATGVRYVGLQQTYKGIPVYNQVLVLSFRNGKMMSNFGAFDPNMEKAINVASGKPSVTAESAVQSALSDRGFRASQMAIAINRKDEGRYVEFSDMGISQEKITAQLIWVPDEATKTYKLAWQVYIIPKTTSDYWMVRVNAVDNSILGMDNYTDYDNWGTPDNGSNVRYPGFEYGLAVSNNTNTAVRNFFDFKHVDDPTLVTTATYRVVPYPAESPLHPGGAPALRTDPWTAGSANATTLRWHTGAAATDYNYTRGNNVFAYHDRPNDNTGTPAEAATSSTAFPNLTFDFVPDFTMEPTVTTPPNQQWNITNLFYWNNIIHDVLYAYGFTEAGRNFQDDNLGRGGAGADWVRAEAQDGGGSNNANFSTPADGSLPRMQMYLWTAPTPDRDGDVDNGIIIHEFGHGVSNRSNAGGVGCLGNAEQAGEGWSDYLGLMLTQNWATSTVSSGFNSPRGIGTYALNQPNNGPGIRPQRYCTDFTVNNATYATLPSSVIPHGVGFVFCSALWELTWELINDPSTTGIDPNLYNFAGTGGNVVALRLVMEGLRLQQCNPGFISARNAIMRADTVLYGASHACAIWRAFARRGMGFGAAEGSTFSITDQTVSFTNNPACGVIVGPTVTINQAAAQPDPTSTSPINFTAVFSAPVTGFAAGDVTVGGTAGGTITQVITGGPTTYNIALSGMTTAGTVTASIAAGVCVNAALEPNNASTSTDNVVTWNPTPPSVCTTFVGTVGPANTATALRAFRDGVASTCAVPGPCTAGLAGALHYVQHTWTNPVNAPQCVTVTYNNTAANFSFVTAHNGSVVLTNLCTNYLGDPGSSATAGTPIVWSFTAPPLATIVFHVGNVTPGQIASYSLLIDAPICVGAAAPTVTINQAAAQPDPTGASPINYTAVFSEPVTGFATGDVTIGGTAGATTQLITGGPTTYNVAISGMTGSGTVIPSIAAGVCTSTASSTANVASTSTDNSVTYNAPAVCTNVNQVPNQTVCHLSPTAAVNFTSGTPGTTFSWVNNTTSIGLAASGSGPTIASFIATNPTTAPVTATITVTPTLTTVTATTTTFNFTGGAQTFTVPAGVSSINITTLGAQGGAGATGGNGATGGPGGLGSRATGTLAVTPGQVLTIFVGGQGGVPTSGFNGGGTGGNANSGGGGGGSDVRFPGATSADRILVAGGGGGGGRAGCEPNTVNGGAGGNGDGNGANGVTSPNGGGGFGAIGTTPGGAGIGCAGFLGSPGLGGFGPSGGNGGAGQSCCCFTFASVPGGGGGGGGFLGGAGGGGGSAGTTGCLGNDKGGGGGGAGGTSSTSGVTAGVITTGIQTGNGQVVLNYNVTVVCTGPTMAFTITVNPTPAVDPIPNQVVCQNAPTAPVNFTGTPVGVVFQWTNNTPAIGLAASGTGNIPSFIAQNPTALPLVATITVTPVTGLATPIVTTYNFTGAVQTFTVPAGITSVNLKSWGAQGNSNAGGIVGGRGGYAEGNLTVVPGQVLNVYVGGGATTSINGGYNGGGNAGTNAGCAAAIGGGGGGASDVRIAPYALANRVIVGAGGGGAGGNRTAGCGRGTGGGGGGGLWGGGGGAGWPGVPPGGPVPTGGTQVAGGAAGVTTWTGGGPTNGFPGVLAVGGAGGIEVGSAQGTPTGPAEQGGVGGGLTGGAGLYNSANNWNGHSGAGGSSYIGGVSGGITTAGLRTGAGQVQVTYTPISAATCFGVARSFTITVNPNANLIIVADPGTTICEGDPTLLTVFDAGAVTAPGVLYTQGTTPVNGSPSQVFEPANAAFTSQGADNFTIPSGGLWNITQITANGIGAGVPTSVNVFFYANSGSNLPGAAIASMMNITTFVKVGGNYTVTLPSAVALGGGTYWMSFQVNMSFAAGGQWFWGNFGAANINQEYAWQNPGGGFATPCTAWGYGGTGCNVGGGPANRNNIFSIIGTSVGLGPQSTGTFLWSPALGLSSTTSNPVAASPMNTTTYTVVRTTVPGGCQASAQVTITVNKRPVVTAQPANIVRCVGNTATFTVGGTGTGLTYQWQLNTAGCGGGGTWTNLTNLAPYSGVTTATLTVNPVSGTMSGYGYRCVLSGTCTPFIPPTNVSNCATLTVNPNPNIAVTPVGPVCGGVMGLFGTALNVTSAAPPVPGNASANSGVIAVPIPDGSNVAATSNLTIAGIPANATLGEIRVNMNINHTWVGDVDVSLRAPNLAILNLVGSLNGGTGGNAGDNFTNTTFSSLGGTPISGAPDPRTGTFAAEARVGFGPIGFIQAAAATWANLAPPATPLAANGVWTLAAGDKVLTDVGTITNWSISIDYTTPGSGTQVLNYVWSPLAGLYTNTIANIPYAGTNLTTVYAAPTVQTTYTVRATDVATGCFTDASVLVNYTPPPPTITPSSVTMCLGDPAVRLVASSSTPGSQTFCSGTVNIPIPDGPTIPPVPTSYPAVVSNITVAGIPAGATITGVRARLNVTHAWVSDLVIALKAPNGQIVNLSALLNRTNQAGANFTNTLISSTATNALGGAAPYTGTYADDAAGATFTALGFTWPGGPVGYVPTTSQYADLYTSGAINGVWSIGIYDAGAPDGGTLNNWCIEFDYIVGVVASGAIWTPNGVGSGLFNDAAASSAYIGDRRDTVWARPTPIGANPYQVTVNNVISSGAVIPLPAQAGTFTGNVRGYWFTAPSSFTMSSVEVPTTASAGNQSIAVLRFNGATPPPAFPGTTNAFTTLFLTQNNPAAGAIPVNITVNAGDVIGILGYRGTTNSYTGNPPNTTVINGTTVNLTRMGMQFPLTTTAPQNIWQEAAFQISRVFFSTAVSGPGTCVSPPRTVIVTVNQPTVINANIPVNQTICTDKVATFSAAVVSGTGPHSYQWQVSTNSGVSFANVANGGVYSGATTATLTITAPPVSMSNYQYRCIITGAAPCAAQTSRVATLVVNPLPVIVISATAPRSLFPGLRSTFTSTVTPNPAGPGGYSWIRNGVVLSNPSPGVVSGLGTGSIVVDVDGQGDYQLRVTDVNGCTNISNTVTIKDSLNGKCFIYPNPTSGKFQVRYHSVANNVLPRTLTINDAKGDRVFTQRYTIGFPYDRMEVDLRGFGKGMYWVEIGDLNGNRLAMCRVVVQ